MATVPQNVILNTALATLEPPVFAARAPKIVSEIMANPYKEYSIFFIGSRTATNKGKRPPAVKAAPDASAACMG